MSVEATKIQWDDVWRMPLTPQSERAPIGDSGDSAHYEAATIQLVAYGCSKVLKVSMFPYI